MLPLVGPIGDGRLDKLMARNGAYGDEGKAVGSRAGGFAVFEPCLTSPPLLRPNCRMRDLGPRPTLGELHRTTPWVWLWCERCQHHAPLACAVAVIRWGPNASSDKLRAAARCTDCGGNGATIQRPGWAGTSASIRIRPS
jgi:hypothetical protein